MSDTLVSQALALIPFGLAVLAALGFLALTTWRPAVACALFAFVFPLTVGLVRGAVVPLLRANEALLILLLAGLVLHHLRRPRRYAVSALDMAVGAYAIGVIVISALVLLLTSPGDLRDLDTLRNVLSPAQFLVVYLVFSRTEFSDRGLRAVLNLAMLASIATRLLAVFDVAIPSLRAVVTTYYPPAGPPNPWDPVYRPGSTLGHYSAAGAFATLNFTLALALLTGRQPGFSKLWLRLVMTVNLAGLVASLTWAPLLTLPLVIGVVLWHGRRIPRELPIMAAGLGLALILFWPSVAARSAEQGVFSSTGQLPIPQTFVYRMQFWEEFFIPAFKDHLWLGTGTVLPTMVPWHLVFWVDNEYLREGFRAGLLGIALLMIMHATIAVMGWRSRASPDGPRRSLSGACLALVIFFVLCGLVGEYMFFGGVSQQFAMMIGLAGATKPITARVAWPSLPRLSPARVSG